MSNPREEWIARARKVWSLCAPRECGDFEQPTCDCHEAIATGLAQSFYNGVKVGLADLPDEGPVGKRLVEG